MSDLTLVVRPEVDVDLLEAETWYNQKESGLGTRFLRDVRDTIDRLFQNPFRYQVRYRRLQVRWVYTRNFPFTEDDTTGIGKHEFSHRFTQMNADISNLRSSA